MDDESFKCADCGKDLRLHTKEEMKKCISGMSIKEKEMENDIIEIERSLKEWADLLKSILDNSDKENPVYPMANELHESVSGLNSRLSEYTPGKFTIEDCMDDMKEYEKLGKKLRELLNLIRN